MKRNLYLSIAVLVLVSMILVACGGGGDQTVTRPTPPPDYAGKTNPLSSDANAIANGAALYTDDGCSGCHGDKGMGDGPAGQALNPKASNLVEAAKVVDDAYLYWRIVEGGLVEPMKSQGSAMPPHPNLSETEVWQLVSFIRSLK